MTRSDDEMRDLLARYPSEPDPDGAAELAAEVLGQYGFTADDILDGLAEGGTITILPLGPDHGPAATSPAAGPEGVS